MLNHLLRYFLHKIIKLVKHDKYLLILLINVNELLIIDTNYKSLFNGENIKL